MVENRPAATVLAHLTLILGVLIIGFPVYLTFVASTQTAEAIVQNVPMSLLPGDNMIESYKLALMGGQTSYGSNLPPAAPMLWVSTVTALIIAIGKIAVSLLSAFAVVYFRFPGRSLVFWMIFVTLMLPVEVRILPTYKVVSDLGMLNTYAGLSVPLIASATATFLFRQFFLTVPDELVEAARIDGAGPMRFFKDVLLPLSTTSIAALFVIQFIYGWNQYLWPLADDHRREHVPGGDGHQAHDLRRRCGDRVELGHGHCDAGDDSAGAGRNIDAALVRQGLGGQREMSPPPQRPAAASPSGGQRQRPDGAGSAAFARSAQEF